MDPNCPLCNTYSRQSETYVSEHLAGDIKIFKINWLPEHDVEIQPSTS